MDAMTVTEAEQLARKAFAGVDDLHGIPYICHVERVAANAPVEARVAAWLHDVVEDTDYSFESLAAAGVDPDSLAAVRLLTRDPESGLTYMDYVRQLAAADGAGGKLARAVKRADLNDNLSRPTPEHMKGIEKRYRRALELVTAAQAERGES